MNNLHCNLARPMALALFLALGACSLQPHYLRPALPIADQWHASVGEGSTQGATEVAWATFIEDPALRSLINTALENSQSLKVAALNVESARAQYGIQRAALLPSATLGLSKTAEHLTGHLYSTKSTGATTYQQHQANLGISSWEMDFFGRLGSLRDEALENYLAYEATRQATLLSLIADVAQHYFTLCAYNDLHRLAQSTAASQGESLALARAKFDVGSTDEQDVLQAQTSVQSSEADVSQYERQRHQAANALELLIGAPLDAEVAQQSTLKQAHSFKPLQPGLPSDLLARRPDIIAAEHTLKAANANIGAARAAFFPSISLTASAGSTSSSLSQLFASGTGAWAFTPSLSLPIFDGGKNRASLDVAKVNKRIEVANYQQAIQNAFKEVDNALVGNATYAAEVKARRRDVDTNTQYLKLASMRYEAGRDDYLQVLTAQRSLYSAQQQYIDTLSSSLAQQVTLYKALGGGWN